MNVKMYEFKKAITSPIVIGLVLVLIFFNLFNIYSNSHVKSDLRVVNEIVDKFRYEINDKMKSDFKEYYNNQLKTMNEITYDKTSKTYEDVSTFLNDNDLSGNIDIYSKEEQNFIADLIIVENYHHIIQNIDSTYSQIDLIQVAETEIMKFGLGGKAADTVREQYTKLGERFEELKENGEHKNIFFISKIYRMHSLLFKNLFGSIILQVMILVVLITGRVINYEFENKTHPLVYSTKKGRRLMTDKFFASIFASIIVTTIILGITLSVYFMVFNYSGLWNVPISSYFNLEYNLPYISWWNMFFVQYLLCSIVLVYICEMLFTAITFIISAFIRNTYIVFFIFGIIFGLGWMIPAFIPRDTNAIFIGYFTPFTLVFNSSVRFMESGAFTTFKYYELITIIVWSLLLLILSSLCIRRFKRRNIY